MLRDIESHGSSSVAELHNRTGLHENTLRAHLKRLVEDGYLRQETVRRSGRGRPTHRWTAIPPETMHPYAGLTVSLVEALEDSGGNAAMIARQAGLGWGRRIAEDHGSDGDARSLVMRIMREQGFAPDEADVTDAPRQTEASHHADGLPIELRRCPLLAAANRSKTVCAVHEGMIEGIVRGRSPRARAELRPFAADGSCLLHLSGLS